MSYPERREEPIPASQDHNPEVAHFILTYILLTTSNHQKGWEISSQVGGHVSAETASGREEKSGWRWISSSPPRPRMVYWRSCSVCWKVKTYSSLSLFPAQLPGTSLAATSAMGYVVQGLTISAVPKKISCMTASISLKLPTLKKGRHCLKLRHHFHFFFFFKPLRKQSWH